MTKITVLPHPEYAPEGKEIEAKVGDSICEALLDNGVEIEHARWFTRAELTAAEESGEVLLPGWASIASRIIASWRAGTLPAPEG